MTLTSVLKKVILQFLPEMRVDKVVAYPGIVGLEVVRGLLEAF